LISCVTRPELDLGEDPNLSSESWLLTSAERCTVELSNPLDGIYSYFNRLDGSYLLSHIIFLFWALPDTPPCHPVSAAIERLPNVCQTFEWSRYYSLDRRRGVSA